MSHCLVNEMSSVPHHTGSSLACSLGLLLLSVVGSVPGLAPAGRQQMPISGVGVPPHGALGIVEPAGPAALHGMLQLML